MLKFNDYDERDSFILRLKTFFQSKSIAYVESEITLSQLMAQANTKEMRDELLKRFFKTALAAVSVYFMKLLLSVSAEITFFLHKVSNICYKYFFLPAHPI